MLESFQSQMLKYFPSFLLLILIKNLPFVFDFMIKCNCGQNISNDCKMNRYPFNLRALAVNSISPEKPADGGQKTFSFWPTVFEETEGKRR